MLDFDNIASSAIIFFIVIEPFCFGGRPLSNSGYLSAVMMSFNCIVIKLPSLEVIKKIAE